MGWSFKLKENVMRGVKAKAIRKLAKQIAYYAAKSQNKKHIYASYSEMTKRRKKAIVTNKETGKEEIIDISLGTIMLDDGCEKKIYRNLKKSA